MKLAISRWALAAVGVMLLGFGVTSVSADTVARTDDHRTRERFETSSTEVTDSLHSAIEHEEDLVVSAGAFFAANPDITNAELQGWSTSVRAAERYPELLGLGAMAYVPHAALAEFTDQLHRDPSSPIGATGALTIVPAGERPFYCLLRAAIAVDGSTASGISFGVDYCAGEIGASLIAARDTGTPSILAVPSADGVLVIVQTPIYRGGSVPSTVGARRALYIGNLGLSLAPDVLFDSLSDIDAGATITLTHTGTGPAAVFADQAAPDDPLIFSEDFGNGWSATVAVERPANGVLASHNAIAVGVAGVVASMLLGGLIYALGTGRKRALRLVARRTDELRHQALHDGLSGLPNRTLILDRVEQLLARCRRNETQGAALYIDLDGFKNINDSLGHNAGDLLLQAVADRLTTKLRDVDTIGRMGGDEFVILVEDGAHAVAPTLIAERVLDLLREPFELGLGGRPVQVTTSIGIATGIRGTAGDLLRDADIALYSAKNAGRNCFVVFQPDMEAAVQHQYELDNDLRAALDNHEFRVYYQPIYDLGDLSIVGSEALLRWQHPTRGLMQPDDFVGLLEDNGMIVDVGRWVLMEACMQAKRWHDMGNELTVAVNVSGRQLDRDCIVDDVAEALATSHLDPAQLTIEITETALMQDTELTALRLHALKALGVQLAIDDFGTGYSSLAYLQRFPVDCLKIDRSFTNAITQSKETAALIHTLVQLGKDLGLKTLAEGVETTDELDMLRDESVDSAQGFLLARPLSVDAFEQQLLLRSITPTKK
jgi:diguanylate cyclase (GGDEF)-like protein